MSQPLSEQFRVIFRSTNGAVARLALSITRDPQLAQDASQEAYLALLRALRKSATIANHRAWLRRVVIRKCNALRAPPGGLDAPPASLDALDEAAHPPADSPAQDGPAAEVRQAIAELPPELRHAVTLRFFHGCTGAEIADAQGCAERTARQRVEDAVSALRRILADPGEKADHRKS
jgi:RNA polymerase sigma-70 factor (ECF subfamily)